MTDPREAIEARLADWDREHETTGCPGGPGCIHTAAAALRAVLARHGAAECDGWCGCGWVVTGAEPDCPTVSAIATELDIPTGEGADGG